MNDQFHTLRQDIKDGNVIVPGDNGYDESLARWSATCVKPAAIVVKPTSASEVSAAIRFANSNNMPFTVMCGGHSTSGSSASDGGMVIHLERMRQTRVDPAQQTVTFEGGCTWADVNNATCKHGLATIGGIVSHTGVGGLILGGGYGLMSGREGLAIDCLLSVEIVLADGSIIVASEKENADLFWAIRGAGASFGVVTKFTSRIFPQGDVWGGFLIFELDKLPKIIAFTNDLLKKSEGDENMLLVIGISPQASNKAVAVAQVFYNGPADAAKAVYKPLLDLQPILDTTGPLTYPKINTLTDQIHKFGRRYLHGGSNFVCPLSAASVQDIADIFLRHVGDPRNKGMEFSRLALEIGSRDKISSVPFESTSCANRNPDSYNVSIILAWEDPDRDDEVRQFCRYLSKVIRDKIGQRKDVVNGGVGIYNNYRFDSVSPEEAFGAHAKRLVELKQKYDPLNRFDKQWKLGTPSPSAMNGKL